MLNTLKNEGIVDKNLVLVDKETKICMTLFITKTTYYIYENHDSELVAINYNTDVSSKNDYDYSITIYNDVSINDVDYTNACSTPETYYTYIDGKKTGSCKYNFLNQKVFTVYKKNRSFLKRNM